jgi:hypothetical protein
MNVVTDPRQSQAVEKFVKGLFTKDMVLKLGWEDWLSVTAPHAEVAYTRKRVAKRYSRNGYEWDIHASIWQPEKEVDPSVAFVMCHGTNGSECNMELTPDGRPGMARVLASQGFKVMTLSYPGHYGPGENGAWTNPVEDRLPRYLDDRELSKDEITDRMFKCTFDTNVMGVGMLVDEHLAGRRLIGTNGPMCGSLPLFIKKAELVGVATAYGHGGTDGWRLAWREKYGLDSAHGLDIDDIQRKTPKKLRASGYENDQDLTPWGRAEEYIKNVSIMRSQMKTSLCVNQHDAMTDLMEEYPKRTGLSRGEYFDYLKMPRAEDVKKQSVLMLVGEKDKKHWIYGDTEEAKREVFMGYKYAENSQHVHVGLLPRHGHLGHGELHNEKAVYLWLWAHKAGYFGR